MKLFEEFEEDLDDDIIPTKTKNKKHKVFLGGTISDSEWRENLIELLNVDYFNPVVDDWSEEDIKIENEEKEKNCDILLFHINSDMQGVYSIAEAVDSVHNSDKITLFSVDMEGFSEHQVKSLNAVVELLEKRGGFCFVDSEFEPIAEIINDIDKFLENEKETDD